MSTYDFTIDQGSTNIVEFVITENNATFDLTGYSAVLMARKTYGSGATVISATSTPAAGLVISVLYGKITLTLTPAMTMGITFNTPQDSEIDVVYDLEITSPTGEVYKPARGTITINREVSRA